MQGLGAGVRGHAQDLMISHRDSHAMLMAMGTIGSDVVSSEDNGSGDVGDGIDGEEWSNI